MMGIGALLFVLFGGGDMLLPNRTANEDFFLSVILPIHATNLSTAGAGEGCGRNHCSSRFGYHIQHLIDFLKGIRVRIRCWPCTWKAPMGPVSATVKTVGSVTLNNEGNELTGRFRVQSFDLSGTLLTSFTATVHGKRIQVEQFP